MAWELAHKVLDRPFADQDDDLAMLARQFLRGRERLLPMQNKTMEITIRVRGEGDEMDSMRQIVTFEQIAATLSLKFLYRIIEEMLGKIVTAPILTKLIQSTPPQAGGMKMKKIKCWIVFTEEFPTGLVFQSRDDALEYSSEIRLRDGVGTKAAFTRVRYFTREEIESFPEAD